MLRTYQSPDVRYRFLKTGPCLRAWELWKLPSQDLGSPLLGVFELGWGGHYLVYDMKTFLWDSLFSSEPTEVLISFRSCHFSDGCTIVWLWFPVLTRFKAEITPVRPIQFSTGEKKRSRKGCKSWKIVWRAVKCHSHLSFKFTAAGIYVQCPSTMSCGWKRGSTEPQALMWDYLLLI